MNLPTSGFGSGQSSAFTTAPDSLPAFRVTSGAASTRRAVLRTTASIDTTHLAAIRMRAILNGGFVLNQQVPRIGAVSNPTAVSTIGFTVSHSGQNEQNFFNVLGVGSSNVIQYTRQRWLPAPARYSLDVWYLPQESTVCFGTDENHVDSVHDFGAAGITKGVAYPYISMQTQDVGGGVFPAVSFDLHELTLDT